MKNLLFLTLVFSAVFLNSLIAQNIDFGLKSGMNISSFTGGDADRNNLIGFHIGAIADIEISEKFYLQPELLYSTQGSEAKNEVKVKVDYLTVPLMAKYYVSEKISIEAGPQFAFLLNDKAEYVDSDLPDEETDASSFDFGLGAGIGFDITENIFTQARYNFGITTVAENPDIKNSVFQISLGYKF